MATERQAHFADDGGPGHWFRTRIERIRERLRNRDTRVITSLLLAAAAVLAGALVYWIVLLTELPSTEDLQRSSFEQATVVYSSDGTEITRYQDKNRRWVDLDEISDWVPQALLATEDHRFYEHSGIDIMRTVGSAFQTLTGDLQGGSTITMQFARNAFPDISDDWMFTRKFKEWVMALRIEGMYSKDRILEMYLNTVPFMYNAFGIEAASQTYFQIPASELNVKAAATLVGMLKGTVFYNPVRHPERSHDRRNVVLEQMVRRGYLEESRYQEIKDDSTVLNFERLWPSDGPAPHFAEYLRQWLDDWAEQYDANLYTDGLRVHTTLDIELQQAAQDAVDEIGSRLQDVANRSTTVSTYWRNNPESVNRMIRQSSRYQAMTASGVSGAEAIDSLRANPAFVDSLQTQLRQVQAGFVALDPNNGRVLAWVGGRNFERVQYDHVAMSKRQPGSTFKPFVYATALANGFSQTTMMRDEVVEYVDPDTRRRWRPTNVGGASGRMMPLRDALAYSKNTITAQLVERIGASRVVDYAHRMGIQSDLRAVPSIGLGTSEVSLLELAGAYSTLANYGRYQEPIFVTRIEDARGAVVARFSSESRQAIPATIAYSVLDMMRGVADYGSGVRIRHTYGVQGDVAAKTGTSQNGADGWFMLVHPDVVAGSWVGFTSPGIHFRANYYQQGAHTALPVVGRFYQHARALEEDPFEGSASFQPPAGWVEPEPIDTTSDYQFASYYDSLEANRDSLFRSLADSGDAFDFGDDDEDALESLEDERERDEELAGVEGIDAADSLNRRERQETGSPDPVTEDEETPQPDNVEEEAGEEDDRDGDEEAQEEDEEEEPQDDADGDAGAGNEDDQGGEAGGEDPDRGSAAGATQATAESDDADGSDIEGGADVDRDSL